MIGLSVGSLTDAERSQYEQDGYFIARGLFTPTEADALRDVFQGMADQGVNRRLQDVSRLDPDEPLARYPRMMQPHRCQDLPVGPPSLAALLDPRIEGILMSLLGEEPLAAQSMFYFKPPGARGQDLHQDNFYLRVSPGSCMAAWMAIDDADRENGGMVVVPGSHKLDVVCPEKADREQFFTTEHVAVPAGMQEVPVDLKRGDVLFFNGSVIHGSYPNTSRDRFRRALIFHYIPAGSRETAHAYKPLLRFNGEVAAHVDDATGGGPCGTEWE